MRYIALAFILFLWTVPDVSAHPGRTDANGGHTCRTNCPSWGLEYGEYHYHGGSAPAPYIAPQPIASPKPSLRPSPTPKLTSSPTPSPSPEVKGESISLEPTPMATPNASPKEATAGDTAIGFGLLAAMIGGGYLGIRKIMRRLKS